MKLRPATHSSALKVAGNLTGKVQNGFLNRIDRVRTTGHHLAYGMGDDMDVLFSELVATDFAR